MAFDTNPETVEVGIDIGGTFTDVVCRRNGTSISIVKLATTRADPSLAVLTAVEHMVKEWNVAPAAIKRLLHGTTIATNAVLERKGARVGLITSHGFRDVLEIGRVMRQKLYGAILEPETPVFLAPRKFRKEATEQISSTGGVIVPLDEASVITAVDDLVAQGVDVIAVAYIFSFLNSAHEQRTREIIRQRHPKMLVSLSSDVDPAFREYERTVVTAFDAYMKPVVDSYLQHLETGVAEAGVSAPLQIMQSRGLLAGTAVARLRPVRLFMSGPAGGVIGGSIAGAMVGRNNLITIDIGGTSSDIALVENGQPIIRSEGKVGGYLIRVPMVDVNAIGSGGGSIAWLDDAGGLRVGPHSAGSDPGPACYGRGGQKATVTDASIVLGYLNPDYFAGGSIKLDPALARTTIEREVAKPLGLSVEEAALGIHRVVNATMAEGIRLVSVRQGRDPRDFTLVALGGAGPVHATALAADLNISSVVIPVHPGVLAAAGLLSAPTGHEVSAAYPRKLAALDIADLTGALHTLDAQCAALMANENLEPAGIEVRHFADMCYVGQSYHLEIPFAVQGADTEGRLREDFLKYHEQVYGYATDNPISLVNLRTVHQAKPATALFQSSYTPAPGEARKGTRLIRVAGAPHPVEAGIYARTSLIAGTIIAGPAVVEQTDTTTLLEPGWTARVCADGSLLLEKSS
jgi:N-methylhydantoinase A